MILDFFKNIFAGKENQNKTFSLLKPLNSYSSTNINYSENEYDNVLYRACIDRIAQQVAKLTPIVKIEKNDYEYSNLEYLLSQKPNAYMNRYDFFYKIASILFDTNNCFIYKRVVNGVIEGFYPIQYSQIEFVEYQNEIFAHFRFASRGIQVYIPLDELIILRRHYNSHELFGSTQKDALRPIFQVIKAIDAGMINSVEGSTQLRGIIKYTGQIRQEDLKKYKDEFVESYMSVNSNGIAALDSKCDFVPLTINPKSISAEEQKLTLEYFNYNFGVSEAILKGEATEDEYNAFYELVIEPCLTQISLEFTNKIFKKDEIKSGNQILLTANKLLFANVGTKTMMLKELMGMGVFSVNEGREIFGLNPIENGDKHIFSLNYIDMDKANEYQVGDKDEQ